MYNFWQTLNKRERIILIAGGIAAILIVLMVAVRPLAGNIEKYRHDIPKKKELLAWMRSAGAEVKQLRATRASDNARSSGSSPLAVIDLSAKKMHLDKSLTRVEPEGDNGVKVWIENAVFNDTVKWLFLLSNEYGIIVTTFSAEAGETPGYVNERITLSGS